MVKNCGGLRLGEGGLLVIADDGWPPKSPNSGGL
jgi:hypothetical protein